MKEATARIKTNKLLGSRRRGRMKAEKNPTSILILCNLSILGRHRAGQIDDDFTDGNQLASLTLHGFILPAPQTRQGPHFQANDKVGR